MDLSRRRCGSRDLTGASTSIAIAASGASFTGKLTPPRRSASGAVRSVEAEEPGPGVRSPTWVRPRRDRAAVGRSLRRPWWRCAKVPRRGRREEGQPDDDVLVHLIDGGHGASVDRVDRGPFGHALESSGHARPRPADRADLSLRSEERSMARRSVPSRRTRRERPACGRSRSHPSPRQRLPLGGRRPSGRLRFVHAGAVVGRPPRGRLRRDDGQPTRTRARLPLPS